MTKSGEELTTRFDSLTKIEEAVKPYCKGGKLSEWHGHFLGGKDFHEEGWGGPAEKRLGQMIRNSLLLGLHPSPKMMGGFLVALEAGVLLDEPIALGSSFSGGFDCPFCGESLQLEFTGEGFAISNDPCPYPDGLVTEFELNVPSGKIVVDDDLRQWFPVEDKHDVNALIGRHKSSLDAAKAGFAYGCVGNTCPGVFKDGDQFVIGNYHEEIWDEEKEEDVPNPEPCLWGKQVANICTDLWWYSIADFDEFERRRQHYTPDRSLKEITEFWTFNVVDMKPGVYKFRQDQDVDRDGDSVAFATFEWVREPDPVVDYLGAEQSKSYSATEVLIQRFLGAYGVLYFDGEKNTVERWEGLTAEEKAESLAHEADSIMCVLGGGMDWHENGFPRMTISEDAQRLAKEYGNVPPFDFQAPWYPISAGYGGLCLGAGVVCEYTNHNAFIDLAPSFVLLGLNICQNVIKFGEELRLETNVYPPAFEVPFCRERMQLFADCYRGLRDRNPDVVFDEEFDIWMLDDDRVAEHIAEFDFGPDHPPKEEWGDPPPTIKKGSFFELDATVIEGGHFSRKSGKSYSIGTLAGTQSSMGHLHVESSVRPSFMVPLKAVGRVLRGTGDGHFSTHLVVTFDYGSKHMNGGEFAFDEKDMKGVRQFDDAEEYAEMLAKYKTEFGVVNATKKKTKKKAKKKMVKKK